MTRLCMRQARQAGSDQPHASDPARIRAKHRTRSGTEPEGGDSRMKHSLIRTEGASRGPWPPAQKTGCNRSRDRRPEVQHWETQKPPKKGHTTT